MERLAELKKSSVKINNKEVVDQEFDMIIKDRNKAEHNIMMQINKDTIKTSTWPSSQLGRAAKQKEEQNKNIKK